MNQALSDIMDIESRNELVKKAFNALKRKFGIARIAINSWNTMYGYNSSGATICNFRYNDGFFVKSKYSYKDYCIDDVFENELLEICEDEDVFISWQYTNLDIKDSLFLPKGTTLEQLIIQADLENLES